MDLGPPTTHQGAAVFAATDIRYRNVNDVLMMRGASTRAKDRDPGSKDRSAPPHPLQQAAGLTPQRSRGKVDPGTPLGGPNQGSKIQTSILKLWGSNANVKGKTVDTSRLRLGPPPEGRTSLVEFNSVYNAHCSSLCFVLMMTC